jgi:hypothetical protein
MMTAQVAELDAKLKLVEKRLDNLRVAIVQITNAMHAPLPKHRKKRREASAASWSGK